MPTETPGETPPAIAGETPAPTTPVVSETPASGNNDSPGTGLEALTAQLKAVNAESAQRRHKIAELTAELEQLRGTSVSVTTERDKLAKKLEELTADRTTLVEANSKVLGALAGIVENATKSLPDSVRSLLTKLDPIAQAEWLAENMPTGGTRNVNGRGGNPPTQQAQTAEMLEQAALKYNIPNVIRRDR